MHDWSLHVWVMTWAVLAGAGVRSECQSNNGYEAVVAISQDLPSADGPALISSIKNMINEMSRELHRSTHQRIQFEKVKILIPKNWTGISVDSYAITENYLESDIRVAPQTFAYKHQPYTLQPGGCGQPGLYIHLTPQYITNYSESKHYGKRGKTLVMEWAKLRWGVFDEVGYRNDRIFPTYYIKTLDNGETSSPLPTLCHTSENLGEFRTRRRRGRQGRRCDPRTAKRRDRCRFRITEDQVSPSSLTSYLALQNDRIVEFCSGETSDHPHDKSAPTKQNSFCNKQSAWEVMLQHEDFAVGRNPNSTYQDPIFEVIQESDTNYVLVLDYSGSMNGDRVAKLVIAVRHWLLHVVADGSYVAIVKFTTEATLAYPRTQVLDSATRSRMANSIDASSGGGTNIGSGILYAVDQILAGRGNPVIVLLTDGQDSGFPSDHVMARLAQSGTRVVTIAFGASAEPKLETVALATCGKTFSALDHDNGTQMLNDGFYGALAYQPPPPPDKLVVTIHEESISGTGTVESSFDIDQTVGRNLVVRCNIDDPHHLSHPPRLITPSGNIIQDAIFDSNVNSWTLRVPMAEPGKWKCLVDIAGSTERSVHVNVKSQSRDPDILPIIVTSWISSGAKDVDLTEERVVAFAMVKQGDNPVIGATVRAFVIPPNAHESVKEVVLLDNGQGADTLTNDGIYSRYVTGLTSTGRYSVKAQVTAEDGKALVTNGILKISRRRRRSIQDPEGEEEEGQHEPCCGSIVPHDPDTALPVPNLSRTSAAGSFKITVLPAGDKSPPIKVRDLRVSVVEGPKRAAASGHYVLNLVWTAPGDDLDVGQVSSYILKMTRDVNQLNDMNFDLAPAETLIDLSSFAVIVEAGQTVNVTFPVNVQSSTTLYLAFKAVDDEGNTSPVSNIAVLSLEVVKRNNLAILILVPFAVLGAMITGHAIAVSRS